jgi:hypothetical protein
VPPIRAIVFDSNVFGRQALPNVTTIRLWAQACAAHDAELWIPEVVACELAQHVVEEHEAYRDQHDAHRQRLAAWGQSSGERLSSIGVRDVLAAIRKAGAEIIPLDEDAAREAILDQVLLRGVGRRKSGVKTGAADSAWVRSIIAYNEGEPDGLIVVTGDTEALERTCAEIGVDVPRNGKHLGDVRHLLDDSSTASVALTAKFDGWMQAYFVGGPNNPHDEGARLQEVLDLGIRNWWNIENVSDDGYGEWELQDRTVAPVSEAQVISEVAHDRWTDTLTATVKLTAEAAEQYARQDPFGDYLQHRRRTYPGSVRAELRLFIEDGELAFDGVLEEIELLSPGSLEITWDAI